MPDPRPDPAETTDVPLALPVPEPDLTAAHDNAGAPDSVPFATPAPDPERPRTDGPVPDVPGYAIEGVLGRGGMGVVYRARQVAANRPVALKMILAGDLAGESERERLRSEAEAIARLNHPNIVQIYEVGEHRGLPFFSLEYCAGGSLAGYLAGNPMRPAAAARLVAQLAGAVGYAHDEGIVHRDLKPANILLTGGSAAGLPDTRAGQSTRETRRPSRTSRSGRRGSSAGSDTSDDAPSVPLAKITDFGLAKHLDAGPGQTRSGQVMGTPSYMAPEQALGNTRRVGPACDVYALGAILYECLTGRPPFRAATTLETLDQVRHREPIPVRDLTPTVPRDLETICLKCLQKDAHRRYKSADDLADDLRKFLEGRPIVARPVGPVERATKWVRRNKAVSAVAAVAVFILLAGIATTSWAAVIARNERKFAEGQTELAKTREGEANTALARERDAREGEKSALYAKTIALSDKDAALTREIRTSYARSATLASMEYERNNIPAVRKLLAECPEHLRGWEWHYLDRACRAASWEIQAHPPGRTRARFAGDQLVTSGMKSTVKVWDAKTHAHQADLADHDLLPFALAAGPGAGFAVSGEFGKFGKLGPDAGRVILWDLARKERAATITGAGRWGVQVHALATSPDGKQVAIGGGFDTNGKLFIWDARGDGSVKSFELNKSLSVPGLAFTADGARLIGVSGEEVFVFAADTGTLQARFAGSAENIETLAAGPNPRQFAVGYANGLVRVFDIETRAPVATFHGHTGIIEDLAFSPDGRWVASASSDGSARVWDITSGNQVFHLRGHAGPVTAVTFSPDGYELVTAGLDGTVRGWDLVFGNEPVALYEAALVTAVAGAPNSHRLAWATEQRPGSAQDYHVTVFDFDRGVPVLNLAKLHSRVDVLALSADGRHVAIGLADGEVQLFDIDSGEKGHRIKADVQTYKALALAFSPDGRTLAIGGSQPPALLLNVADRKRKARLDGHAGSTPGVAFRPGGAELATAGYDGTIRVWKAADGSHVRTLTGHVGAVTSVEYRADGKTLASCGVDGRVRLWNADTGALLNTLEGHSGQAHQVAFTPNGSRLVSTGSDRVLRCWDPDLGASLLQLTGPFSTRDRIAWVGGDGALACANGRTVLLWQKAPLPLGEMLTTDKKLEWHALVCDSAKIDRNWFTMEHHLNWLIARSGDRHPRLYHERGRARIGLGRIDEALADFETAVKKGYADPVSLKHSAAAYVLQRKYDKAAAALEQFNERKPDDPSGLYQQGMLAAYARGAGSARGPQRALRRTTSADQGEAKLISLWLDGVVPDPNADTEARLAEAAKLAAKNPGRGFYQAVHALSLYRAGRVEEAALEAQKAVEGEGKQGQLVAGAVYALALRKLGREDEARMIRETIEPARKHLLQTTPEDWVTRGDPWEWPTFLSLLMLTDEFDRAGRPAPPPIPLAD